MLERCRFCTKRTGLDTFKRLFQRTGKAVRSRGEKFQVVGAMIDSARFAVGQRHPMAERPARRLDQTRRAAASSGSAKWVEKASLRRSSLSQPCIA